jgi:hypothetical protein
VKNDKSPRKFGKIQKKLDIEENWNTFLKMVMFSDSENPAKERNKWPGW